MTRLKDPYQEKMTNLFRISEKRRRKYKQMVDDAIDVADSVSSSSVSPCVENVCVATSSTRRGASALTASFLGTTATLSSSRRDTREVASVEPLLHHRTHPKGGNTAIVRVLDNSHNNTNGKHSSKSSSTAPLHPTSSSSDQVSCKKDLRVQQWKERTTTTSTSYPQTSQPPVTTHITVITKSRDNESSPKAVIRSRHLKDECTTSKKFQDPWETEDFVTSSSQYDPLVPTSTTTAKMEPVKITPTSACRQKTMPRRHPKQSHHPHRCSEPLQRQHDPPSFVVWDNDDGSDNASAILQSWLLHKTDENVPSPSTTTEPSTDNEDNSNAWQVVEYQELANESQEGVDLDLDQAAFGMDLVRTSVLTGNPSTSVVVQAEDELDPTTCGIEVLSPWGLASKSSPHRRNVVTEMEDKDIEDPLTQLITNSSNHTDPPQPPSTGSRLTIQATNEGMEAHHKTLCKPPSLADTPLAVLSSTESSEPPSHPHVELLSQEYVTLSSVLLQQQPLLMQQRDRLTGDMVEIQIDNTYETKVVVTHEMIPDPPVLDGDPGLLNQSLDTSCDSCSASSSSSSSATTTHADGDESWTLDTDDFIVHPTTASTPRTSNTATATAAPAAVATAEAEPMESSTRCGALWAAQNLTEPEVPSFEPTVAATGTATASYTPSTAEDYEDDDYVDELPGAVATEYWCCGPSTEHQPTEYSFLEEDEIDDDDDDDDDLYDDSDDDDSTADIDTVLSSTN